MKFLRIISLFSISLIPSLTLAQEAAKEYTVLAPLDGVLQGETIVPELGSYLNTLFRGGVMIAGALAVIMITIGGIQYMSSDAVYNKGEGKEKIKAALLGLLIAVAAVTILQQINPQLIGILNKDEIEKAKVEGVDLKQFEVGKFGETEPEPQAPNSAGTLVNSQGHSKIDAPIKPGTGTTISSLMAPKISNFNKQMNAAGLNWQVTEGFPPPKPIHKSKCHYNGTCIDANFTGTTLPTPENIRKFIELSSSNNMRAVYETNSIAQRQSLISAGIPSSNVIYLPGGLITAPHFSVYNQ